MIKETIAEIRVCAFCCIYLLLNAVMIENGQYFYKGAKRTFEEMFSNWKNKMAEAAEKKDILSSFMNLASLQFMIDELAEDVMIDYFNIMDQYDPLDLKQNAEVFDRALLKYLDEYKKIGIHPKHFDDVEAFTASYLQ